MFSLFIVISLILLSLITVLTVLRLRFNAKVNIEHIMPSSGREIETIRIDANIESKDEFLQLVNKIGNKILLEEDINKSISRDWFKTKKNHTVSGKLGYKESKYCIANTLSKYSSDCWTKDDIDSISEKIADRIIEYIFQEKKPGFLDSLLHK